MSDVHDDEEDPETVQGLEPSVLDDLGIARKRDPDRLPPHNAFEWAMNKLYGFVTGMGGGNVLYAIKAGIFTSELFGIGLTGGHILMGFCSCLMFTDIPELFCAIRLL